jgi:hypothetical protein
MNAQRRLGPRPIWCSAEVWTKAADEFDRLEQELHDANHEAPGPWLAGHAQQIADGCRGYAARLTGEASPPPSEAP